MPGRLQIVAIVCAVLLLAGTIELVRRRRLQERYSLLWLLSATTILVLAIWSDGLTVLAESVGIATPSNALFAVAFGFVLLLLLHYSLVISRLSDQNKVLAQQLGLTQHALAELRNERQADVWESAPHGQEIPDRS